MHNMHNFMNIFNILLFWLKLRKTRHLFYDTLCILRIKQCNACNSGHHFQVSYESSVLVFAPFSAPLLNKFTHKMYCKQNKHFCHYVYRGNQIV